MAKKNSELHELTDKEVEELRNEFNGTTEELENEKKQDDDDVDSILDDIIDNPPEGEEPEPEPDNEEDFVTPEDENENEQEDEPPPDPKEEEEQDFEFEGINLADFITAEMAIAGYQDFWVMMLSGAAMLLKKDIHEDRIRVSSTIEEMSVELLDIYWQTIKIKINPVLAAAVLMAGANIKNFTTALKEEKEKEAGTFKYPKQKKSRKPPPQEDTEDVDFEDVTDQTDAENKSTAPATKKKKNKAEMQEAINKLIEENNAIEETK